MKSQIVTYIFIVFLSFCFNSVYAQTELKNKIVDFEKLLTLENANIYIQNSTIGTISNSDGKFVLQVPKEFENIS